MKCGVVLILFLSLIMVTIIKHSDARELRPSEHGLVFQNESRTTEQKSPEMLSFFGGTESSKVPLPEARNLTDPSWRSSGGGRRDHVRKVWLVVSLVCGVTGVALLVVVGIVFMFRFQKHPSTTTPADK